MIQNEAAAGAPRDSSQSQPASDGSADEADQSEPRTVTEEGQASGVVGEDKVADDKNITSDNSSDDEFYECANEDEEKSSDEKDVDTQEEPRSSAVNRSRGSVVSDTKSVSSASDNQSRRESRTDGQSESELDCCNTANNSMTNLQTRESVSSMSVQSDSAFKESYSHKPEGRLAPFGDLRLINCEEKMYIPVTQEPAPMTEDMLEEHAEVLAK